MTKTGPDALSVRVCCIAVCSLFMPPANLRAVFTNVATCTD